MKISLSIYFIAIFSGLASQVFAQDREVRLRAGEHPNFSRIVLDVPPADGWNAASEGRRATIEVPKSDVKFDTRAIFPDRRVTRVSSAVSTVRGGSSRLELLLSCDCLIEAFAHQGQKIVIDIFDPATRTARSQPITEQASHRVGGPASVGPYNSPAPRPAPRIAEASTPATVTAAQTVAAPEIATSRATPAPDSALNTQPAAPKAPLSLDSSAVENARARLVEQLRRAVAQGLIEPAGSGLDALAGEVVAGSALDAAAESDSPDSAGADERRLSHAPSVGENQPLEAATAVDLAAAAQSARDPKPSLAAECVPEALLAIAEWGVFQHQRYPVWPDDLLGEFDRPNPESGLSLARAYLHAGLGFEAVAALDAFAPAREERSVLDALAAMLDGAAPSREHPFSPGKCGPRHRMWRLAALGLGAELLTGVRPAAGEVAHRYSPPAIKAAQMALAELPPALRARVGAPVAASLLAAGDGVGAHKVLEIVGRAGLTPDPREVYLRAMVAAYEADWENADRLFRNAADSDDPISPVALLGWVKGATANKAPPPDDLAERVAEARLLYRGSSLGLNLAVVEAEALAAQNGLQAGVDILLVARRDAGDPGAREAIEGAARRLLATHTPHPDRGARYLVGALDGETLIGRAAKADRARAAVAENAIALGAPAFADQYLAPALGRRSAPVLRAAARSALARGRPSQALTVLLGLEDDEAASIRAEALGAEGKFVAAARAARSAGREAEADQFAWLARDWSAAAAAPLSEADEPVSHRRALAAFMVRERDEIAARTAAPDDFLPPDLDSLAAGPDRPEPSLAAAKRLAIRARAQAAFLEEVLEDG